MRALLTALTLVTAMPVAVSKVEIPGDGVTIQAPFYQPATVSGPPIVALHGCGGPYPARDRQWRGLLNQAGHAVLFPNSFASRGLGPQCNVKHRTISPGRQRRADTVAAVRWLLAQPSTPPGGVFVLGWSNGGSTTLWAAEQGVMPEGAVRAYVAFYPGCRPILDRPGWKPGAPLLILMGDSDDWTPAEPCRQLAARFPGLITLVTYQGAYHDFDVPGRPIVVSHGRTYTATGTGTVHTGTNEPAREDAIKRVLAWFATH